MPCPIAIKSKHIKTTLRLVKHQQTTNYNCDSTLFLFDMVQLHLGRYIYKCLNVGAILEESAFSEIAKGID